jgi:hypothetical protein
VLELEGVTRSDEPLPEMASTELPQIPKT